MPVLPKKEPPRGVAIVEVISSDNEIHTSGQMQFDLSPFGSTGSHIVVVQYGDDEESRIWVRNNAILGFSTFHYNEIGFIEYEEEQDDEFYGEEEVQTP
jgi:hypothetical protein